MFKKTEYQSADLFWFSKLIKEWFLGVNTAQGLLLQITDVFIPEMGKVNNKISLNDLAQLLEPFLHAMANTRSIIMLERIKDSIFTPLLQSNVTEYSDSEDSEDEDLTQVDGGKLSKRTRKELKSLVNQKYVFDYMNILMYAENYIFPVASLPAGEGIIEDNREKMYELYNFALQLEPETKPELTFS